MNNCRDPNRETRRHDDEQVAREQVRKETNRQADKPKHLRQGFERPHDDAHDPARAARAERLQITDGALCPDALNVVDEKRDQRERQGDVDVPRSVPDRGTSAT